MEGESGFVSTSVPKLGLEQIQPAAVLVRKGRAESLTRRIARHELLGEIA